MPAPRTLVAVDVGGTRLRMRAGAIEVETAAPAELQQLPAAIGWLVDELGVHPAAIGVGCAGMVDHDRGMVRWSPHLAGRDVALGPALRERWGVPTWVDNDANAAALAEARTGSGRGHRMVLMVAVGTGIGAGLVVEGSLERGRGHLGEVGHMVVAEGPPCRCGRAGCWEAVASGTALDRAAASMLPGADGRWLVERAREGDPQARGQVATVGTHLADGIGNLALAFDPDVIVLGGIVVGVGELLLGAMRERLADLRGGIAAVGLPPIVPAHHGDRAGLEGAMMGAEEVVE